MSVILKRLCPSCKKELLYSCTSALNLATRKNSKCIFCVKRGKPSTQRGIPFKWLYNHVKYISKHRNITNALTFDDFLEFTKINNCYYCGNKIIWNEHNFRSSNKNFYNGYNLDRKNNSIGYEKNNCVACCEICNYMKRMMSVEDFINHCKNIVNNQKNK
jgi:hypothetical protein